MFWIKEFKIKLKIKLKTSLKLFKAENCIEHVRPDGAKNFFYISI